MIVFLLISLLVLTGLVIFLSLSIQAYTLLDAIEFKQLSEKYLTKTETEWWSENLKNVIGILIVLRILVQLGLFCLLVIFLSHLLFIPSVGSMLFILSLLVLFLGVSFYQLVVVNIYADFYHTLISTTIYAFKKIFIFLAPLFKGVVKYTSSLAGRLLKNYRPDPDVMELSGMNPETLPVETLSEDKKEMIYSIYDLGETLVREVMIPRVNMICIEEKETIIKGLELIVKTGHSRIPVYQNDIDHIVGLLYAKDLLRYWQDHDDTLSIKELLRDVFFVPETKHINELLTEFQKKKNHIALVVDEYGGTSGLITIEDILEEIVGEIRDEYDQEKEKPIQFLEDGSVICDAKVLIDDITDELGIEFPDREDYDTLGGFLFSQLEKIPGKGEVIHYRGWRFIIAMADDRSIKKVKILKEKKQKKTTSKKKNTKTHNEKKA